MLNIIFVDFNESLVKKVSALGIESHHSDFFTFAYNHVERPVLMTASNPFFSMGGGLDWEFAKQFPKLCEYKRNKGTGMERIMNVCFTITVDDRLKATKESVRSALKFAIENTHEGETLLLSGVGTGIGGISEEDFISALKEVIT